MPEESQMSGIAKAYVALKGHLPRNRSEQDEYGWFRSGYEAALGVVAAEKKPNYEIPTTPGVYEDADGDPWMLTENGYWGWTREEPWAKELPASCLPMRGPL